MLNVCKGCGQTYEQPTGPKTKYCSIQCFNAQRRGTTNPNMLVNCERCGKQFKRNAGNTTQRFCSIKCARNVWERKTYACLNCGKECIETGRKDQKFCSQQCNLAYNLQTGENHPMWKGGKTVYRRFLKSECERCGSARFLLIHQKDENRENNDPSNLETLCKACHQAHHGMRGPDGKFTCT